MHQPQLEDAQDEEDEQGKDNGSFDGRLARLIPLTNAAHGAKDYPAPPAKRKTQAPPGPQIMTSTVGRQTDATHRDWKWPQTQHQTNPVRQAARQGLA
ncbi:hypothetical protein MVI01_09700 [Myxococcus virescens]|uniref:Uncharacterized protein n=1 Tax=Myxococcus virescens TaxID=83456 RepID=A0A511H6N0_9BACT|nr:hypothetical protein MVI01_09700 [Myxococcus virescens]